MKNNIVLITGLLVAGLAAGAIFQGFYVRLSTSPTEQEFSGKVVKELSRPADEAHSTPSSYERDRDMETLIQQVSVMSRNMNTLQDQINGLAAKINAEGIMEEEETSDNNIATENQRDESPPEQPSMRYTNEIRDDQWASPAEATIVAEFTTNPEVAGVIIDSIECRSSLCRVAWQYNPDMTNEEAFITENEMLAAMNKAGLNASSQSGIGAGSTEGYFWYNPPLESPPGSSPSSTFGR